MDMPLTVRARINVARPDVPPQWSVTQAAQLHRVPTESRCHEKVARKGDAAPWSKRCPCCDPLVIEVADLDARGRLESLMHHGGRRAHRLRAAVSRLDGRFRAATVDHDIGWQAEPWWARRQIRD